METMFIKKKALLIETVCYFPVSSLTTHTFQIARFPVLNSLRAVSLSENHIFEFIVMYYRIMGFFKLLHYIMLFGLDGFTAQ